jgi:hypothetical protein
MSCQQQACFQNCVNHLATSVGGASLVKPPGPDANERGTWS